MVEFDEQTAIGRRTLLRGALAAPVGAAAIPLLTTNATAAPGGSASTIGASQADFDRQAARFAIAVLPDTQYLFDADSADPEPLRETFRYLVAERKGANIAFMAHLGDVTEHGTEDEIDLASKLSGRSMGGSRIASWLEITT